MAQLTITCNQTGSGAAERHVPAGSESWAVIRSSAGTDNADLFSPLCLDVGVGAWTYLCRTIYQFDLSDPLLTGSTITGVTFRLKVSSQTSAHTRSLQFRLVNSTPASNTALQASDYGQIGTTAECNTDIALGSFAIGDNDMTGNATLIALANSKIGSYLSLGGRWVADITNSEPTSDSGNFSSVQWDRSNTKIIIDYTPKSQGASFLLNFV